MKLLNSTDDETARLREAVRRLTTERDDARAECERWRSYSRLWERRAKQNGREE